jgi:hypothetical protein
LVFAFAIAQAACGGSAIVAGSGGSGGSTSSTTTTGTGTTTSSTGSGSTNFAACSGQGQCVLTYPGCCEPCHQQLSTLKPINKAQLKAFRDAECTQKNPICDACLPTPNPNLFAYCDAGQCIGADLSKHPLNSCTSAKDCRLRAGTGCCECGGQGVTAIPINAEQKLTALVCAPNTACAECAPTFPANVHADCVAGKCVAVTK